MRFSRYTAWGQVTCTERSTLPLITVTQKINPGIRARIRELVSINSKMGPRHSHPHARHNTADRGRVSSPSQQTHRVTSHRIKQLHGHRRKIPQRRCCCNSTSGQPAVPGDAVDIGWPAHLLVRDLSILNTRPWVPSELSRSVPSSPSVPSLRASTRAVCLLVIA
jgi:hypothetical protein